ncbi:MAG: DNA-directed RNA polymerase subunit L [Candidatus Diapherotrites archaeon]
MDIEIVKNEKNLLEFILKGERHTYPNLLKSALLEDSSVEFVSYILDHPMDNDSRFVVRTKKSTPKKALEDATKKIESDINAFDLAMKKALK